VDSLVSAAARALRAGDPLGALKRVALRDDPPALALRGIAMAQLGELDKARLLLRRAARGFGPKERLARARCLTAEAEVALASRQLGWPAGALDEALDAFAAHGDPENALHARLLQARRLLLIGQVSAAEQALSELDLGNAPPALLAIAQLVAFDLALRRTDVETARVALGRAQEAAGQAGIPALSGEVEQASRVLATPAARLLARGQERSLLLEEVQAVLQGEDLVVDACRRCARAQTQVIALAGRPILFALLRILAEAWPDSARREVLIARVFGARRPNPSHRARLRVEMGRLRTLLRALAEVRATSEGFALMPRGVRQVLVLAPPIEGADASVLALLADGEGWSTSALALALGSSQRTVQRALPALEAAGQVRALGRGRTRRWLSPTVSGFTTTLLLPGPPSIG
jgi:DNA-binding transcriptional ArsR family regulator